MTAGQGLALVVGVWVLVTMMVAMLVAMILILTRTAKAVTSTTESIQERVDGVASRAHQVLDQGEEAIGAVTAGLATVGKVAGTVGGALSGARVLSRASSVAKGSTSMAFTVLTGIKAGMDRFLRSENERKGDHHEDG